MKMTVIGSGMMGSAIVSGIVKKGILPAGEICISDPDTGKVQELQQKLGVSAAASNREAAEKADLVLLAVKPQFLSDVLSELKGHISENTLLLSIVAGVPIDRYVHDLDCQHVVRIMPNTPAQIGEGMCAWYATEMVNPEQKALVQKILGALGVQMQVTNEHMLDMVTAISGSGPAYVYLFLEAMIDAGVQLGLPRKTAETLTLQTVIGSARYMQVREAHPAVLRNEVTSPAGTTAEALHVMESEGFRTALADGILACYDRTMELGKK